MGQQESRKIFWNAGFWNARRLERLSGTGVVAALVQTSTTLLTPVRINGLGPFLRAGSPASRADPGCAGLIVDVGDKPPRERELAAGPSPVENASGDNVGGNLVFDEGDTVAQQQLALLQALQPQQIRRRRLMQRIDRRVEVAVFLL